MDSPSWRVYEFVGSGLGRFAIILLTNLEDLFLQLIKTDLIKSRQQTQKQKSHQHKLVIDFLPGSVPHFLAI